MTGVVGLAGLFAWAAVARVFGMAGPLASLCGLLACGVPMVLWAIFVDKVHRNESTGIDWDSPPRTLQDIADISIAKIAGLWGIWAIIGGLYCIGRWYWDGQYLFAMYVLGYGIVPVLILSVPYVFWLDRRLKEPRDGAWHFGQLLIGRPERADKAQLADFYRAWAVKGFFLAFMISIVPGNWWEAIVADARADHRQPGRWPLWLISLMFMIDVTFATVGYVLTLKPLDAHIRRANPYRRGWVAALICYPPFILMNDGGPLDYSGGQARTGPTGCRIILCSWRSGASVLVVLTAHLRLGDGRVRHPLLEPHPPRHPDQRPLCLDPASGLCLEEPVLVAVGPAVPRDHRLLYGHDPQHGDPRHGQRRLLLAREDRGAASVRGSGLSSNIAAWMDRNGPVTRFLAALRPGGHDGTGPKPIPSPPNSRLTAR